MTDQENRKEFGDFLENGTPDEHEAFAKFVGEMTEELILSRIEMPKE